MQLLQPPSPDGWDSPAHTALAGDRRDCEWRRMSTHLVSAICRSTRDSDGLLPVGRSSAGTNRVTSYRAILDSGDTSADHLAFSTVQTVGASAFGQNATSEVHLSATVRSPRTSRSD